MNIGSAYDAAGSMAGYLFQCRLALLLGLQIAKKKPNGHLSIERFDDIAFHNEDFSLCLMQAKHSINPKSLADKSVEVWRTLEIWIGQMEEATIPFSSTKCVLISTSAAPEGSAMALLRPGTSDKDRKNCLMKLQKIARLSKNNQTKRARRRFLSLSDEQAITLLRQIEILDQHPDLIDVMEEIEGELILTAPQHTLEAAERLEGWWLGVVAHKLFDADSPLIPVQHIIMKANEIGRSYGEDSLPLDDPETLGAKDYSHEDESQIFVKQMRIVGLDDRVVRRGAQHYYRAFAQRSKWAREQLLLDTDLSRYDARLGDHWERRLDEELGTNPTGSEEEKKLLGRRLCLWASQQSIPLRNVVEAWITAGSYHGLSGRLKVGWHPDYRTILGQEGAGDNS